MSHQLRILIALVVILGLTVVGSWAVMFRMVIEPVGRDWANERVDTALAIAEQAERTGRLEPTLRRSEELLNVRTQVLPSVPTEGRRHRRFEKGGREVHVWRRPDTPIVVALNNGRYLGVRFPTDVSEFPQKVVRGLFWVALIGLAGVGWATRWVARPLTTTRDAMVQVTHGDLGIRVPEGNDLTGQMGATFNQMAKRVQGMVDGQRELLAAVSHELRTPLTRMRLLVEILEGEIPAARQEALTKDINEIDGLVDTLLESTRLERGGWALQLTEGSLHQCVVDALSDQELQHHQIHNQVPDAARLQIDVSRVTRALRNLFSNFVRYCPPGSTCTVSFEAPATLVVEDDGPGVAEEAIDKLFTPFYRVDASRSREKGGLGLGLMLVRQIVEAHGGTVMVENASPGLRFRLCFG